MQSQVAINNHGINKIRKPCAKKADEPQPLTCNKKTKADHREGPSKLNLNSCIIIIYRQAFTIKEVKNPMDTIFLCGLDLVFGDGKKCSRSLDNDGPRLSI